MIFLSQTLMSLYLTIQNDFGWLVGWLVCLWWCGVFFLATEHFDGGGGGVWDVQDEVQVLFHNKTSLIPSADNKALSFQKP